MLTLKKANDLISTKTASFSLCFTSHVFLDIFHINYGVLATRPWTQTPSHSVQLVFLDKLPVFLSTDQQQFDFFPLNVSFHSCGTQQQPYPALSVSHPVRTF